MEIDGAADRQRERDDEQAGHQRQTGGTPPERPDAEQHRSPAGTGRRGAAPPRAAANPARPRARRRRRTARPPPQPPRPPRRPAAVLETVPPLRWPVFARLARPAAGAPPPSLAAPP